MITMTENYSILVFVEKKNCYFFMVIAVFCGVPKGIRTPDLQFRKLSLYPAELLALISFLFYYTLFQNATFPLRVLSLFPYGDT